MLLDLSRANYADPGLSDPVFSRKPDYAVGQAIQELSEFKDALNNLLYSAPPASK
jgi:hypothetical protein